MRTVPRWTDRDRSKDHNPRVAPHEPILRMDEIAEHMHLTIEQVKHAHASALLKLRAALIAYGYNREINR